MYTIQEIRNGISNLGLSSKVEELSENENKDLLARVLDKYSSDRVYTYPLWEHVINSFSKRDSETWQKLDDFLPSSSCILFLEPEETFKAFKFEQVGHLTEVLGECFGFVFYITDDDASYLLSFNDHDYVIASGKAKKWLEEYEGESGTPPSE